MIKIASRCRAGFSDVRQNGDSTGEGTVSDIIGLSFVYFDVFKFFVFLSFLLIFFSMHFIELFHASPVFIFESAHKLLG